MRIAVIGTRAADGPARDGMDQALRQLWPRLARRGHVIDVFSERNGHALPEGTGLRTIRLPSVRWGQASSHAAMAALVSACRAYDVVNFVADHPAAMFSRLARFGLHRTVVSLHGAPPDEPARPPTEGAAARFADVITVSSRRLERLLRDRWGREAIYIPNGIAPPARRPDPAPLAALGLEPGRYLLLAGRLAPRSDAHLAVGAMAVLDGALPLVVAETGPGDDAYVRALADAAEPDRVRVLGPVAADLLDALTAHAYLYLHPSQADDDTAGLAAALAHGRAVVVSDLPDHLDLVGGDGFTFTAGEFGDLRRVLAWLMADGAVVAAMGERAGRTVAERYDWDRVADAYEHIYQALL